MKHPMFLPQFVYWMFMLMVAIGLVLIVVAGWMMFVGHPG